MNSFDSYLYIFVKSKHACTTIFYRLTVDGLTSKFVRMQYYLLKSIPAVKGSGGSSVSQNKLPQLILGYIYILKYLKATSLVRFYSFEIHNL